MNKVKLSVCVAIIVGLLSVGWAGVAKAGPQTKCPILNSPTDEKVYTDYKGKRIYFCCSACIDDFKKDPEKYTKKMEAEGVTPANTPKK